MIRASYLLAVLIGLTAMVGPAAARTWTDDTGKYTIDADLVAFDGKTVVLKSDADHRLIALDAAKLSSADQQYLQSSETQKAMHQNLEKPQTWTLANGQKIVARVVDYARRDIVIQRQRGKIYVNDKYYDNLPDVYQEMVPLVVNHFEKTDFHTKQEFMDWVANKLLGKPLQLTCDGVMMEFSNGDLYGIPFFFFSEEDLKVLQPGWEKWLAAYEKTQQETAEQQQAHEEKQQQATMLEAQAQAYQQDRQFNQQVEMWNSLKDWVDLWEVVMVPRPGTNGQVQSVVVPARDSDQAQAAAMQRLPGYMPDAVRKVSRKN